MKLELRHLRIVCAIADAGSVTKAAATLGLAQPALAAQLKRIERAIGGRLFDRGRQGSRPTPLGELVLARARLLLPAIQGLEEEAARLASDGGVMRAYRIGAVNGPILSGLVQRLTAERPHAMLTTHTSWEASELADMITNGRLDYALIGVCGGALPSTVVGAEAARDLVWRTIAVDAVFVLLPVGHPLARADEVKLADLADTSWVVTPGDGCFRSCFATACARAGFTVRDMYEGDVRTCFELVEAGAAVAPCQASLRPPPGLVTIPLAGVPLHWRHMLGWHPDAPAARHATEMVSYAIDSYQSAIERLPHYKEWLRDQPRFGVQSLPTAT